MTDSISAPRIPRAEYEARIERVREALEREGLEVGLAYATQHMPGDIQYLTGYDPHVENAALFVLPDDVIVMGGAEGEKVFEDSAQAGSWRNLTQFEIPFQDYGDLKFWTLREVLEDALHKIPLAVGLLSAPNVLSVEIVEHTREALDSSGELRDVSEILANARYHKSAAELELYRWASDIAGSAMRAMVEAVEPGVRELEVAAAGDSTMKRLGAYAGGFDTIVCSGARVDTVIGRATTRVIEEGDMVMLGVAPRYEGYTSALGRTLVAGEASPEQAELLEHGLRAFELAAAELRVSEPARNIDIAARQYLAEVGLDRYHAYGVGHGIGLSECLEWKTATQASDYDLPSGIAMQLDVGLFGHPSLFGLRHEDPFLISHEGVTERLTDLPMKVYR